MKYPIVLVLIAALSLVPPVQAEKICLRTSQSVKVNAGKVKIKGPSIVRKAAACPSGYRELTDLQKLPAGSTMTGAWNLSGDALYYAPATISFPRKLSVAPAHVEFVERGTTGANCTGSATAPTAPAGYLCIYEGYQYNLASTFSARYWTYALDQTEGSMTSAASAYGAAMYGYNSAAGYYAWGTWAVTEP